MACGKCPLKINRWTGIKLHYLERYLQAYVTAAKSSIKRAYLDAFAGCGKCLLKDTKTVIDGSALRALKTVPPFTEYHFIEIDRDVAGHLRDNLSGYANVHVYEGDCNRVIVDEVLRPGGMSQRAASFAFLDPPGLNLRWATIEALARYRYDPKHHRKMELLILYPFDMVINAKLFNPRVADTLDSYFGSAEWRAVLAESQRLRENRAQRRERFVALYVDKLKALGYEYVYPHGPIYDKHKPLYYFVFATDHPAGDTIMRNVWASKKPPILEDEMGYQPVQRPLPEL